MSVYFAKVGRYIKVGYSANPERRVRNLFQSATRYGAPRDISAQTPRELLAAVDGTKDSETRAHASLGDFRVMGEWFIDEPEVREFMAACVAENRVLRAARIDRPDGKYRWFDDPVLYSDEDREADRRAANALNGVFAAMLAGRNTA